MDGVFMKKALNRIIICACFAVLGWSWGLISDRQTLNDELLRLHVIAASDDEEDQNIKLRVRDVVIASISEDLKKVGSIEAAQDYIRDNLPKIEQVANDTLQALGCGDRAKVALQDSVFDTRYYDTFALPAGVYEALKITIGRGEGKNWWCVVFPTLCIPSTAEGFENVAAGAGFSDSLTKTLEGEYEIRFYLLDLLGKWQSRGVSSGN